MRQLLHTFCKLLRAFIARMIELMRMGFLFSCVYSVEGFLMVEFRNILIFTLGGILHLAHYARIELGLPASQ